MMVDASIWGSQLVSPHIWDDMEYVEGAMPESLDGDFTLIGWYKSFETSVLPVRLWNIGIGLIVDIVDNAGTHQLKVSDGANGIPSDIEEDIVSDGSDWTMIAVRRCASTMAVFEGSNKLSDTTISVVDYGSSVAAISKGIKVHDLRILNVAASDAAIAYYYNDVVENNGDETQPRW